MVLEGAAAERQGVRWIRTMSTLLHLSGVPAAGKSHFGSWLESNKGFVHINAESDNRLNEYRLTGAWNQCFKGGNVGDFRDSLAAIGQPVALEWGFPVVHLPIVERFRDAGIRIWWFDGRHDVARRVFRQKRGDIQAFDTQVGEIKRDWSKIQAVFGGNIVKTLLDDRSHLDSSSIYKLITT